MSWALQPILRAAILILRASRESELKVNALRTILSVQSNIFSSLRLCSAVTVMDFFILILVIWLLFLVQLAVDFLYGFAKMEMSGDEGLVISIEMGLLVIVSLLEAIQNVVCILEITLQGVKENFHCVLDHDL